ncbi:MAG: hypothetical protein WC100_10840 [Sterolibacterium sp.]
MKRLRPLFQQGIQVRVRDGTSLSEFLVDGLGVDPEYVRTRITTVFLDGSVVDDMDTARLHEGAVLALSAAMPGLVGATMRKGGFYAAMRGDITLGAEQEGTRSGDRLVRVRVKLFNLLIDEIGPRLLDGGFDLAPAQAEEYFDVPLSSTGSSDSWVRVPAL